MCPCAAFLWLYISFFGQNEFFLHLLLSVPLLHSSTSQYTGDVYHTSPCLPHTPPHAALTHLPIPPPCLPHTPPHASLTHLPMPPSHTSTCLPHTPPHASLTHLHMPPSHTSTCLPHTPPPCPHTPPPCPHSYPMSPPQLPHVPLHVKV